MDDPADCLAAISIEMAQTRKAKRDDLYALQQKASVQGVNEMIARGQDMDNEERRGLMAINMLLIKSDTEREKFTQDCLNKYLQN